MIRVHVCSEASCVQTSEFQHQKHVRLLSVAAASKMAAKEGTDAAPLFYAKRAVQPDAENCSKVTVSAVPVENGPVSEQAAVSSVSDPESKPVQASPLFPVAKFGFKLVGAARAGLAVAAPLSSSVFSFAKVLFVLYLAPATPSIFSN